MIKRPVLLRTENLWKEYRTGKDLSLQVLKGADLEVRKGEIIAVVGPSGCGKSTLLHILGALDRPTLGRVFLEERDIFAMPEEQLVKFRNTTMGFVFQFHHLLPEFTALENVCMPAMIKGETFGRARTRGERLLEEVGLSDRSDHRPNELSGGEQQRVAVARALMNEPRLVLADEPSGNLDEESGLHLHKLLSQLSEDRGLTIVVATHNSDLMKRATRVTRLQEGKLTHVRHREA
ncbi:MAG: ABC transporter ATP-binding protein [Ignavibacteria bacterium GWA2_55_11]|nr:MAG: ABC transporter ATP-binding protein [Ignavibacteria bacterium GWA2_55_11]OGU67336.1 MAG: ABC transporter ATP-binding protein [Ignavibacteria bacterium RIFCSPHIGHO2_02_FULL_56_12]OGU72234.1 MAG: ABC transporter ATP-binding protein [Ignavibacteria bacterium RIFCSPLOWO2_02_FULL_55_14]OGU76709.1 MAG: ABC transporter ATP-binding protein [Ignavibacteria bacterium RIFCSPLOWO2_12_FULL_56_21]